MTEQRAVELMFGDTPSANIQEYIEAIKVAKSVLGTNYTSEQLRNWILVTKYPFLLPRQWNSERLCYELPHDYKYEFTHLDDMPNGWRKAFGEMMCEEIMNALDAYGGAAGYTIEQIKEKYGHLRWYAYPNYSDVEDVIAKYSELSGNICCVCGKPDVPMTGHTYYLPLCKKCYCTPDKYVIKDMSEAEIQEFWVSHEKDWDAWNADRQNEMSDTYFVVRWSKDGGNETETYDISSTATKIRKRYYGKD